MTSKIPDKPYLRIGEVARLLGTQTHVLRYWEDSFPQLKPVRAASGQRLFRKPDMETLLVIKRLLHDEQLVSPSASWGQAAVMATSVA